MHTRFKISFPLLGLLVLWALPLPADEAPKRSAVPSTDAQAEATKIV